MTTHELKHTWRITEEAKLLKFYLWLYEAEKDKITFCRWFWGIVCSPLVLLCMFIVQPFLWLGGTIKERWDKMGTSELPPRVDTPKPPSQPREQQGVIWLGTLVVAVVAAAVDWISATCHLISYGTRKVWAPVEAHRPHPVIAYRVACAVHPTIEKWERRIWTGLGWLVAGIAVAALGFGLACGFYYWQLLALTSLEVVGLACGMLIGSMLIAAVVGLLLASFGKPLLVALTPAAKAVDWALIRTGHGFRHFGHFMAFGYWAIKTRTCPRVEVVSDEPRYAGERDWEAVA